MTEGAWDKPHVGMLGMFGRTGWRGQNPLCLVAQTLLREFQSCMLRARGECPEHRREQDSAARGNVGPAPSSGPVPAGGKMRPRAATVRSLIEADLEAELGRQRRPRAATMCHKTTARDRGRHTGAVRQLPAEKRYINLKYSISGFTST